MAKPTIDRFEQRKLTRSKLIDAALQLFSTSGYEHATVDDIAQAAGYSKGAYYFHFSTKDDILIELMRIWTEERNRVLAAELTAEGSGTERLQGILAGFFSYKDDPRWYAMLLEFWAQATRNPEVGSRLSQAYASWRRQLAEAFQAAEDAGELRLGSAADAAAVALAAHDGYAVQIAIGSPGGRAMTPEALAESLVAPLQSAPAVETRRSAAI
jgi:AcrR family transcriptional regulator